jgi:GAF domain-containing protein
VGALPLRLRDATLGALNLLSVRQTPMVEADIIVVRAFADLATVSIVQHRTATEAQRLNEQFFPRPDQPRDDRAGQGRDRRART